MGKLFRALKAAGSDFVEDECMTAGAAIAYYTIFSLPPLLVIVFMIAEALNVSPETIDKVVREQAGIPVAQQGSGDQTPSDGATDADDPEQATQSQGGATDLGSLASRTEGTPSVLQSLGPVSKVIGIVVLLFSATGVFAQFQAALNRAWEVEPDPEQGGVMAFLMKRIVSAGMIVVIVFLLLVSLVLSTLVGEILAWIHGATPSVVAKTFGYALDIGLTILIATLLFAAMYKILPDAEMRWKDMWVGALITAILFVIGKTAIGWYVQSSDLGSSWGSAAASMVGMLVWVYYTSLIVLFGAEIAQYWAREYGAGIQPEEGAVRIKEEKHHIRS